MWNTAQRRVHQGAALVLGSSIRESTSLGALASVHSLPTMTLSVDLGLHSR